MICGLTKDQDKIDAQFETRITYKGLSVYLKNDKEIQQGNFVCEYRGEFITSHTAKKRKEFYKLNGETCHMLDISLDVSIAKICDFVFSLL